jgi:DNA-binding IclR family transcriptional regulator
MSTVNPGMAPAAIPMEGQPRPESTSSVQKACRILRAMSDTKNARLTDIAREAGLDKATTLRLLDVLTRDGFVNRDPSTKHYSLGTEVFVLGAAAQARFDPRPIVGASLLRLAHTFEDTAMLAVPSGAESICVALQEGTYPIRANYLEVGSRRPLGVGAGSLALFAWMPDREIEALMPLVAGRLERYPRITRRVLEDHIEESRKRGYATILELIVERMGGIAVPILGADGRPVAAISIAALTERITSREEALAAALKREVAECEAAWRHPSQNHSHRLPKGNGISLQPDARR